MNAIIKNGIRLGGSITAPPSKSQAIRAALLLALSGKDPELALAGYEGMPVCADTQAAITAARSLINRRSEPIRVGESAALLRIILPISLALYGEADISAEPRLISRGHWEIERCLGVDLTPDAHGAISVQKRLFPGEYCVDCTRSSQFLSGLLLGLPLLDGESRIKIKGPVVSSGYVEMTMRMASRFGAVYSGSFSCGEMIVQPCRFRMPRDIDAPGALLVGGDRSYEAFFRAANVMGGSVSVRVRDNGLPQPDSAFPDVTAERRIDLTDTPDLLPPLAAAACYVGGQTRITGVSRLSHKESDRPRSMARLICDLGGAAFASEDELVINGGVPLNGGECSACGDHRIAMAAAMLASLCTRQVILSGAECVKKSAPGFWQDYKTLGGEYEFIWE